jgi:hypothetical protein
VFLSLTNPFEFFATLMPSLQRARPRQIVHP